VSFGGDSSTVELPLFQGEDGGAIPTSPLQTKDKNFRGWLVERCFRRHIEGFIEKWHYSKSIRGCTTDYCYRLKDSCGLMIGAMFYGKLAMVGQWKRFSNDPARVIELRRLCLIDATPKNAESFFISKSLRLLRKNWRSDGIIVSYSDLEYGHTGIIYRASNFKIVGETRGIDVIIWNGKKYHDKSTRSYYKGKLKPFSQKLRDALESGEAKYEKTKGKIAYAYYL
jgi:hypothetical protein